MLWLVVLFSPSICEVVVYTSKATAMTASSLVWLAAMLLLWVLLRCASKDQVLYLALCVESVRRWLGIVAIVR